MTLAFTIAELAALTGAKSVEGACVGPIAGIAQREDLGVRLTRPWVTAVAHDVALVGHDQGTHHGIGGRDAFRAPRLEERTPHEVCGGYHFSWKIAST